VAQTLSDVATRPRDFLARFGGEEFILVLPETGAEAARIIAERCGEYIAHAQIPHAKSFIGDTLTASLGIGTIVPTKENDSTPFIKENDSTAFIKEVDRRLYQAKQNGRNCIVGG
jgi:diguanylate cyclase (GGDEF)-like protein